MKTTRAVSLCAAALCILAFLARPLPAEIRYTLTDLGTLQPDHSYSYGHAINNAGQVVGYSAAGHPLPIEQRAFLWSPATGMICLGTLDDNQSQAFGINDAGQVVGYTWSTGPQGHAQAFIYDDAGIRRLNLPELEYSIGQDINDAGHIAGSFERESLYYRNGQAIDIGGFSPIGHFANAISNRGHLVGYAFTGELTEGNHGMPIRHAYFYDGAVMHDLGTLGGRMSEALDVNEHGDVVGWSETTALDDEGLPIRHAFLYRNGVMHDLGTPGTAHSTAFAINNLGQVVGDFEDVDGFNTGFVYDNGLMKVPPLLIDTPRHWRTRILRDINDQGQIVGDVAGPEGWHAVVLTPVPEPTSLALMLGALLVLAGRAKFQWWEVRTVGSCRRTA